MSNLSKVLKRNRIGRLSVFQCVVALLFFAAPSLQAQQETALRDIQDLKLPSSRNRIAVYYSPGYEERAFEVRRLVEEMVKFYEDNLKFKGDLTVAILTKKHWGKLSQTAKFPYGLPFVTPAPHVAFLPATADNAVTLLALQLKDRVSPATLEEKKASGYDFDTAAVKFVDLISLHEVGHVYTVTYGINPQNKWFGEFLANYFAYAFLQQKQPKLASLFRAMNNLAVLITPKYTSLDDFESLYLGVGQENYGWYQGKLTQKAVQVYQRKGLSFLADIRKWFPQSEKERITVQVALERLEKIDAGFVEWSKNLK